MAQALPPVPLDIPPGFLTTESPLGAQGRFTGGFGVRFVRGRAEKRGGYIPVTTTPLIGIARGAWTWNDLTARQLIGVGTASKLYGISNQDNSVQDITPIVATQTTNNPLTTTNTSSLVEVAYTAHGAVEGQYVDISNAVGFNGIPTGNLNGSFPIVAVINANNFTVDVGAAATSGGAGGGTGVKVQIELAPGTVHPQSAFGWGAGPWGVGTWGTPRQNSLTIFYPRVWSITNFGKIGLFAPSLGGLYSWDPTQPVGTRAALVTGDSGSPSPQAPPSIINAIVGTSDDIIIALGVNPPGSGTQDPLAWWCCAQGDYQNWNVAAIAGAGGAPSVQARVNSGNKWICGADLGIHITLAWTDESVFAFQYNGSQFVFDVQRLGANCGIIGPMAFVVIDTKAYWMGERGFWQYDGGVSRIPNQNDILETFLADLRPYYSYQMVAWYDEEYDELCFGYVDALNQENNKAVIYNRTYGFWYMDTFIAARTTMAKYSGQQTDPLFFSDDGILYQDNQGLDANGADKPWSLSYATREIASGGVSSEVDGIAMDMERQVGDITATLTATDRTPAQETVIDQQSGTAAPTDGLIDFRVAGRQVQVTLAGDGVGCDFRLGVPKLLLSQSGGRR